MVMIAVIRASGEIRPSRSTMAKPVKHEVITFKADASLTEAMRGISNRSSFIRDAILAALDNVCPLCRGTGVLTTGQRDHWVSFAADHSLAQCEQCHGVHLTCTRDTQPSQQAHDAASDSKGRHHHEG